MMLIGSAYRRLSRWPKQASNRLLSSPFGWNNSVGTTQLEQLVISNSPHAGFRRMSLLAGLTTW